MNETTEIEKKSLEAHVELCAQRYKFLETRLEDVDDKISTLGDLIREVHGMVHKISEKRNDQLLKWGVGIIAVLVSVIGYLLATFALK